ncbi:glycosyltransferase family 4 protein [Paenibacillus sp. 1P03SA]|uniref:glycosyltransferase family 4 protein n=1 Tax=Paenibacillus sp. 1P03SA TaxID=3132294 RepID=UPI0039A0A8A1
MRLAFAYDVTIEQLKGTDEYYHNYFDYTVWSRYLNVFSELKIISRMAEVGNKHELKNKKISSGSGVSFNEIPSISDPISMITKRKEAYNKIKSSLQQCDALIVRLPSEIGALAVEAAEELNLPWAAEVVGHAWDALWNYGSIKGKIYAPIMTYKTKALVKKAPYVLYVTKKFLQKHYPTMGKQIDCSNVELPMMAEDSLSNKLNRIRESTVPVKIGLIGSMASKYKGIDVALKSLSLIKGDLGFRFKVLGEGDPSPLIQLSESLGISDRIEFYKPVPSGQKVFEWLDKLDIYIQPSFQEGLPRALIEAMSRSLPAIGSNVGGIPELLSGECIFEAGDAVALSQKIIQLAQDKDWQIKEAEKNNQTASQYTNFILNAKRTEFWTAFRDYSKTYKKVM